MGKADYYILLGGSETGPWTLSQVQAFGRAGAVTLETLYVRPGASEWEKLSAILDVGLPQEATPIPQSECGRANHEANEAVGGPVEPGEWDLTKLRQWLREKLAAIGLAPDMEETAAESDRFSDWLSRLSGN